MKRLFLFLVLVMVMFVSGCGTVGYGLKKETGYGGKFRSEVYWNIDVLDFDNFWKEVREK